MKLVFTSDLHADVTPLNADLVEVIVEELHRIGPDVFIIAGDIAAGLDDYSRTLAKFSELDCKKLVVAGNHDIWIESKGKLKEGLDSTRKYYELLPHLCTDRGFTCLTTTPFILDRTGFVGTMGWYDYSFRRVALDETITRADYIGGRYGHSQWMDKRNAWWLRKESRDTYRLDHGRHCRSDHAVCEEMAASLQNQLAALPTDEVTRVIAVMHHLPFQKMVRYTGDPAWDFFSAYMGSEKLGDVLLADKRVSHVLCGHTHIDAEVVIEHVRALCHPVGYADEWPSNDLKDIARDRLYVLDLD